MGPERLSSLMIKGTTLGQVFVLATHHLDRVGNRPVTEGHRNYLGG